MSVIYLSSFRKFYLWSGLSALVFLLASCAPLPVPRTTIDQVVTEEVEEVAEELVKPSLQSVEWDSLEGWREDDLRPAFQAFQKSCRALKNRSGWQSVCTASKSVNPGGSQAIRRFFEGSFVPYQVINADGTDTGLITGYYAPGIKGSRRPSARYPYPLLGLPDDLLVVDLKSLYPDLKDYRLRGRLEGRKVVPYWDRREIEAGKVSVRENALFWVQDPVELFFLHIQGSGHVVLPNGDRVMVGYADQNGHPYRSIGKLLLERGEMTRDQMSMQNIKAWGRRNPDKVKQLLAENPSYVFFRVAGEGVKDPAGALGVPLTAERSLAVDRRTIPLGAPVFIDTTEPYSEVPMRRLMMAQDVGGAIKGGVRADFYWGVGAKAGKSAGRMKQSGRLWVLLPTELADI